ncbi:YaiI/YqxD family protein [Robertmurraya massiliosenegalensis]|uniref:YaiI/YqxD family protein n=1 Tax=Robertmurraya massiliosenegalensis TaxID=1287657 RepID=UPI00030018A5|nr:DUF188 domain-containing protein [Robertmurraya massiliosenegalensis]
MDADSCPVKAEIVEIAQNFDVNVSFVASYNHVTNDTLGGTWHYVDSDKEAADLFIMNHVDAGDIAVTQDIGLASTLLSKRVTVLSPRGSLYEEKDIDSALHMRYLSAKARRQGKYGKGPKPFTIEDRIHFRKNFTNLLSKIKGDL